MSPRALLLRQVDALHCKDGDAALARAFGLIAGGAFLVLACAHRLTSPRIGA